MSNRTENATQQRGSKFDKRAQPHNRLSTKQSPPITRSRQKLSDVNQQTQSDLIQQLRVTLEVMGAEIESMKNEIRALQLENQELKEVNSRTMEHSMKESHGVKLSNQFQMLERHSTTEPLTDSTYQPTPKRSLKRKKNNKPKIQIIGDSHARRIGELVAEKTVYSVTSTTMPGAPAEVILKDVKAKTASMKEDDVLVILAGANNVQNQKLEEARKSIKATLDTNKKGKIVIVGIPTRYDLHCRSKENFEINHFNFQVDQLCNTYKNASFIDVRELPRVAFTRHGLHLNLKGKSMLANTIVKNFKNENLSKTCLNSIVTPPLKQR